MSFDTPIEFNCASGDYRLETEKSEEPVDLVTADVYEYRVTPWHSGSLKTMPMIRTKTDRYSRWQVLEVTDVPDWRSGVFIRPGFVDFNTLADDFLYFDHDRCAWLPCGHPV